MTKLKQSFVRLAGIVCGIAGASSAFGAAPAIQSVVSAASYQPGIASAAWTAVSGSNLSATTRAWAAPDFINGDLPTQLDGVSVTVNGKPAYVYFVSPGQINILPPDDPTTGSVSVQVTNSQGTSLPVTVNKTTTAPALFAYSQLGGAYAVGQASGTFELVGPPALLGRTISTFTASPGETLVLYGTGLGPVVSGQPTGKLVTAPSLTSSPVTVTVGGQNAAVQFAGLIGAGLYQINVVTPPVSSGNAAIVVTVNGIKSTGQASIPVQAYTSWSTPTTPPIANCVEGAVESMTYSVSGLNYGAEAVTVGGAQICATCNLRGPLSQQFTDRLEDALFKKKSARVCYDSQGLVDQVKISQQ